MMHFLDGFPDRVDVIGGLTMSDTPAWPAARHALAETLGVDSASIRSVKQVHGATICKDADWVGSQAELEADALITCQTGVVLVVRVADCCGVLLYDPQQRVVAAVHSGWRGTAAGISGATVKAMVHAYGCQPSSIQAWLSPCASGLHYEVGEDVYSVLAPHCRPHPASEGKWLFDNVEAITHQLQGVGVSHVAAAGLCTMTDARFHSYRRDRERSGRGLAFIAMR